MYLCMYVLMLLDSMTITMKDLHEEFAIISNSVLNVAPPKLHSLEKVERVAASDTISSDIMLYSAVSSVCLLVYWLKSTGASGLV